MSEYWSSPSSTVNNPNSVTTPLAGGGINTQGVASSYSVNQSQTPIPTNVVQFNPSTNSIFTFQVTLDESTYSVIVNWNIYAERYYVGIYDLNNTLVVSLPLVGSPLDYNISLTAGYFTSQLVYRAPTKQFQVIG
jgi:hypothetical protein